MLDPRRNPGTFLDETGEQAKLLRRASEFRFETLLGDGRFEVSPFDDQLVNGFERDRNQAKKLSFPFFLSRVQMR